MRQTFLSLFNRDQSCPGFRLNWIDQIISSHCPFALNLPSLAWRAAENKTTRWLRIPQTASNGRKTKDSGRVSLLSERFNLLLISRAPITYLTLLLLALGMLHWLLREIVRFQVCDMWMPHIAVSNHYNPTFRPESFAFRSTRSNWRTIMVI